MKDSSAAGGAAELAHSTLQSQLMSQHQQQQLLAQQVQQMVQQPQPFLHAIYQPAAPPITPPRIAAQLPQQHLGFMPAYHGMRDQAAVGVPHHIAAAAPSSFLAPFAQQQQSLQQQQLQQPQPVFRMPGALPAPAPHAGAAFAWHWQGSGGHPLPPVAAALHPPFAATPVTPPVFANLSPGTPGPANLARAPSSPPPPLLNQQQQQQQQSLFLAGFQQPSPGHPQFQLPGQQPLPAPHMMLQQSPTQSQQSLQQQQQQQMHQQQQLQHLQQQQQLQWLQQQQQQQQQQQPRRSI